jgi:hypothetical protein
MKPEFIFHTEGFSAASALAALASRRADVLLRQAPGLARIRLVVIFERLPSGAGVYAARGQVEGPAGEIAVTEIAHDPDAAILRTFVRLGRQLASGATGATPRVG